MQKLTGVLILIASLVETCAIHEPSPRSTRLGKRQEGTNTMGRQSTLWSYYLSHDWGRLSKDYKLCQTGTQQSPIPLSSNQGLAVYHRPNFDLYGEEVTGTFYNWGYGPAYTVDRPNGLWSNLPRMTFDNETVYLKGWHTHAPADHTVDGQRSKAELHLVHVNDMGEERAVVAIRMEPGRSYTNLLPSIPGLIGFNDSSEVSETKWNPRSFLKEVDYLNEFWTYKGSLTSPPCREGIRWFVARAILYTGSAQMVELLGVSIFSSRTEQAVWQHEMNV